MNYTVRAFAELAGVTVKALHHYERHGLLAPTRSRAGYRRYTFRDLARLEYIVTLRSLGFSLNQIATLMDDFALNARLNGSRTSSERMEREAFSRAAAAPTSSVTMATLRAHRDQLTEKRRRLDEAVAALDAVTRDAEPVAALQRFIGNASWARWEAKRKTMASPAPRAPDRASPSRFALFHEIREALDRDPSGDTARPLVARWQALIEAEAEGNPETIAAMREIAATRAKWPDGARRYVASLYDTDVGTWERVMRFVTQSG
jgi:DNA-binding transcriptional MerR regulator